MGLKYFFSNVMKRVVSWGGTMSIQAGEWTERMGQQKSVHFVKDSPTRRHIKFLEEILDRKKVSLIGFGIRELYEEAGVLFAYDQNGDLLELNNQETKEKYSQYRNRLQKGEISISQIALQEKLLLALDQLRHYAHWITPEARSERFDTHFFIACHPREQEAFNDQKETIEGIWLTPEKALEENLQRKVALSPPTLKTLEDLSRYRNMDDLFKSLNKKEIYPILPILTKTPSGPVLFFPWDPDYEPLKKGQTPLPADLGTLSQSGDNTTRLILQEGFWIPYYKKAIDSMR